MRRIAIAVPAAVAAFAAVAGAAGPANGTGVPSRDGAAWPASRAAKPGEIMASLFDDTACSLAASCAPADVTGTTVNGGSAPGVS